ncbi:MAG: hypothetical protein QHJ73_06360, partial [Armatimonadota bacterium]|nr:hypothetical protein [Armatimonadota bacterium]
IVQPGDTGAARALGMGSAVTALPDDLESILWNPAGIARLDARQFCFFDTVTSGANRVRLLGYGQPGNTELAGAVSYLRNTNQPYNLTETSYVYTFGYNLSEKLSLGANLKYVRCKRGEQGKDAFGGDVGMLYDLGPSSSLGIAVMNVNEPILMDARVIPGSDTAPEQRLPRYRGARLVNVGLGFRFFPYVAAGQLGQVPKEYRTHVGVELFDATNEWRRELRFGVEQQVLARVAARAGLVGGAPTVGLSVRTAEITLTAGHVFAKSGGRGAQSVVGVTALY